MKPGQGFSKVYQKDIQALLPKRRTWKSKLGKERREGTLGSESPWGRNWTVGHLNHRVGREWWFEAEQPWALMEALLSGERALTGWRRYPWG